MKYTYAFEVKLEMLDGKWFRPCGLAEETRGFALGYLMGRHDTPAPRPAMRVVRSDGKVVDEYVASEDVDIGLIAGWPSPEQYEGAAERAMQTAARIRAQQERRK